MSQSDPSVELEQTLPRSDPVLDLAAAPGMPPADDVTLAPTPVPTKAPTPRPDGRATHGGPAGPTPDETLPRSTDPSFPSTWAPAGAAVPAADVYPLGAILYDVLTGRPPLRGTTLVDTLQMVRTAAPVPPRRLQPKVPPDLQNICLKCLEKDPRRRYASVGALADDRRRFLDGLPTAARPVSPPERAWKWARRRSAEALLLAVCVAGLIGLAAGLLVFAVQQGRLPAALLDSAVFNPLRESAEFRRLRDRLTISDGNRL